YKSPDILDPTGLSQSCVSAIQWHASKICSQQLTSTFEEWYFMIDVASVVDSSGRHLTCGSSLLFVNKALSVVPVYTILKLWCSKY
uniref:Ras-GEF domain-containing protein n=1 Tax=Mesocestoides corti TaxID=53468 RepID=A0A5K3G261_MESCO